MSLPVPRRSSQPDRPDRPDRPGRGWAGEFWDPFGDFTAVWNRMMGQFFAPFGQDAWIPAVEAEDTGDAYVVRAELPGMKREDIGIDMSGGELRIAGETREESGGSTLRRRHGTFAYRTSIPADVDPDKAEARLADGILTVRLPKTGQSRSRRIEITG